MIIILASLKFYAKIMLIIERRQNLTMKKRTQKIVVWAMLIVMVVGIVASYAAMFITK